MVFGPTATDDGKDGVLRLTTRKVPENGAVKDRSGLPFGVTVQPFKPLRSYPLDPLTQLESADAIARQGAGLITLAVAHLSARNLT